MEYRKREKKDRLLVSQEVTRRARILNSQLDSPSSSLFLHLPGVADADETSCISCGTPLGHEDDPFRCPICLAAVSAVMNADTGVTVYQVAETTSFSIPKVRRLLDDLVKRGAVFRRGRGVKGSPHRYTRVPKYMTA